MTACDSSEEQRSRQDGGVDRRSSMSSAGRGISSAREGASCSSRGARLRHRQPQRCDGTPTARVKDEGKAGILSGAATPRRGRTSSCSSDDSASTSLPANVRVSMFAHMFRERGRERLVDMRRRALTLIDVVNERHANGPLKFRSLLMACSVAFIYWYFFLPTMVSFGNARPEDLTEQARAGGPWSDVQWQWPVAVTVAYVGLVALGVRVMKDRGPVRNRVFEHMLVYNLIQVLLHASLGFSLWTEAWNFPYPWGNGLDTSVRGHRLGMLLWFHYHCRQLELLDTGFIIMRKKFESWSFLALHANMRLAHMWGWYFACRFACGGDSYFPAAVTCTCQVCVYSYYTVSMLWPNGVPFVRKARVTEVQVLQFILCATHAVIVLVNGNLPRLVAGISLCVMASGLYLYVEWDLQDAHHLTRMMSRDLKELGMFAHMFNNVNEFDVATVRRRTMTLIDVIAERQENGQLRPHRLLTAFGMSMVYWNFLLPALATWGTGRWYAEHQEPTPRQVGGPWADVRWATVIILTVGYLFIVYAGTRFMERRPPVQKRIFEYLVIYNFWQVILNATLSFNLWREAWKLFPYPWGNGLEDMSEQSHRLGMLLWVQYHCRQLELVDTIFVILRKKFHHMSFLHIYLRLVHMWGWFFACRFACGGDSYFPAAVNCTCQVIVFSYYTLSLINDKPHKIPFFRRALVTEVQMSQFVICMLHAGYVLYRGNLPRPVAALSLFIMVGSLFLYVDFAGDQSKLLSDKGVNDDTQQQAQPRLNFRFDSSGWLYVYHFGVAKWIEDHLLPEEPSPEMATSDRYPKSLAFSGSSGGALVAVGIASGVKLRDLFECVLSNHAVCRTNPFMMFPAVESALKEFLPKTAAQSLSGRVRILLTRVSSKPPFITGEVADQYSSWDDAFHRARASCHVPGMHFFPYRVQDRLYFDGLIWSSLMVPWSNYGLHVVKVSALSAPLTDIRAPLTPTWWIIFPPCMQALRGLYWIGYRDAARWFTAPLEDPGCLGCGCGQSRSRRTAKGEDPLISSRFAKRRLAQQLILKTPKPLAEALPEFDPVTGERVEDLIACYRRAVSRALWAATAAAVTLTSLVLWRLGIV